MRIGIDYCEVAYTQEKDQGGNLLWNEDGQPRMVEDGYPGPGGWITAYNFGGYTQDADEPNKIRQGDYIHGKGNFKSPLPVGQTVNMACKLGKQTGRKISFKSTDQHGNECWRMVMEKVQDNSQRGNPYNGGGQRPATSGTPQRPQAPSGHANAPQTPSRPTPKVSERLAEIHAVYPRCFAMAKATAAKLTAAGDAMTAEQVHALALSSAMNLVISMERGLVDHDPSAAQLEAERAAKLKAAQDEIDAAQARAAKIKADAEAQKAGPPGYTPAEAPAEAAPAPYGTDDGVVPF